MDKKWFARLILRLFIGLFAAIPIVKAEEFFPVYINTGATRLLCCSRAELKAFRWIHVGNAALYLEDCNKTGNIFSADPKQVRFWYEKAIPAKAFREAAEEYLKINLGQKFSKWQQVFNEFNCHSIRMLKKTITMI